MKKVAFIAFSDIQIEDWKRFSENHSRLYHNELVLKEISTVCLEHKVPAIFCGDLFDNPKYLTNKVLEVSLKWFKSLQTNRVYIVAIDGNHDQSEQNTLKHLSCNYVRTLSMVFDNIKYINHSTPSVLFGKFNFIGIGYLTNNDGFEVAVKEARGKMQTGVKNILLVHQELPGAVESNGFELPTTITPKLNKLFRGFDLVLGGHIHKPQRLRKNILILGATHHQRASDMGTQMGYWVFYEDLSRKFIPLNIPQFKYTTHPEKLKRKDTFYVLKEKRVEGEEVKETRFESQDKRKLAKEYLKVKGIKSKRKKQLLIKHLEDAGE